MTVSELITELQKHPGYYPVWLITYTDGPSAIDDVSCESGVGNAGCILKISGES